MPTPLSRAEVLDLYYLEARGKLIEIAAFLDRVDRAPGADDYRIESFRAALECLQGPAPRRAEEVLLSLSDPTPTPIPVAPGKGASGAWPGFRRT